MGSVYIKQCTYYWWAKTFHGEFPEWVAWVRGCLCLWIDLLLLLMHHHDRLFISEQSACLESLTCNFPYTQPKSTIILNMIVVFACFMFIYPIVTALPGHSALLLFYRQGNFELWLKKNVCMCVFRRCSQCSFFIGTVAHCYRPTSEKNWSCLSVILNQNVVLVAICLYKLLLFLLLLLCFQHLGSKVERLWQ